MPLRSTVTVSIPQEQDARLHAFLAGGRYRSGSDVLPSALRLSARDEAEALWAIKDSAVRREAILG